MFHFIYADQAIVAVKIPLRKGGLRGLCFSSQMGVKAHSSASVLYNPLNPPSFLRGKI